MRISLFNSRENVNCIYICTINCLLDGNVFVILESPPFKLLLRSQLSLITIYVLKIPPVSIRCPIRLIPCIRIRVRRLYLSVLPVLIVVIGLSSWVIIAISISGRCHTRRWVRQWSHAVLFSTPAYTASHWAHWCTCTWTRSWTGWRGRECWRWHGVVHWRWGRWWWWTAACLRTSWKALRWACSRTCWWEDRSRWGRWRRWRWGSTAADVTSGKTLGWFVAR